tara:strand:+ start:172 stop:594 length:423 start_codon:yes stop_codon:yes gene_type:complete
MKSSSRKLSDVMSDYFSSSAEGRGHVIVESLFSIDACDVPLKPAPVSEWEVVSDPNRLMKRFKMPSYDVLMSFVEEILQYQQDAQHHAKITIEPDEVIIEVYTHDVNDVTELDMEYASSADQILEDVLSYGPGGTDEYYG